MPPPVVYSKAVTSVKWKNLVSCDVVTKAVATLTSTNMIGGSGPDGRILPPGWASGDCPTHHQRGHLIGNKLGGSGTEPKNLVTLTAGTNHPFMYEFEDCVYRCVTANKGVIFTYTVECDYSAGSYAKIQGFDIPGASSNPFCLFPAPASLTLSLSHNAKDATLGELVKYLPNPPMDLGLAASYTKLIVYNGGYKFFESPKHYANTCWAVEQNPVTVKAAADSYAKHLGHLS